MSIDRLAFIGGGNMCEAIISGAVHSSVIDPGNITVNDISRPRLEYLREKYGVRTETHYKDAVNQASIVVLSVKPQVFNEISKEISQLLTDKAVISIMAGWGNKKLSALLNKYTRYLRVMPNMPAMAGCAMSVLSTDNTLSEEEYTFAKNLFSSIGQIEELPERLFNAVIGISGSGPAYAYMFIEALADAGVLYGLPRETAYRLAAQTIKGSATMVQSTGLHPGVLKDMVCSPGGTTIQAVKMLEDRALRGTIIAGVEACVKRAEEL